MKIFIVGKNRKVISEYRRLIEKSGMVYTHKNPGTIISLGGDGTLLYAERLYPGIPKLPIRNKSICNACDWDSLGRVISRIKAGKYRIEKNMKLEAAAKTKSGLRRKLCMNDFVIRNRKQTECIRFEVKVNTKKINSALIGDGLVAATPFGASAYYRSIARKAFGKGIGVAFNNLTKFIRHMVVSDSAVISIKILRNSALLSADNDPQAIALNPGDHIKIRKSRKSAKIIKVS